MLALDPTWFRPLDDRLAEWVVPAGRQGIRLEIAGSSRGHLRSSAGLAFTLEVDPGQERTELVPAGGPLLPRGPDDLPDCPLLDFAFDTAAAASLGPLAALSSGRYLLVRTDHRPGDRGFAHWGNSCEEPPGHHRTLYLPQHADPIPAKRFAGGRKLSRAKPAPRSLIRTQVVGAEPGLAPCLRQPLIGLVVEDYTVIRWSDGVFVVPFAQPDPRPDPDEDLLVVLPLDAPLFVSAAGGVLAAPEKPDWEARIRQLGSALAAPGRDL